MIPPSIKAAFAQANAIWPNRNKASDGSIGDSAHASRPSDHNPDARGIVHAFDLTHDPAKGPDCGVLAEHLRQRHYDGRETRVKYVIFNRRIWNPSLDRLWRPYKGANPHEKHMHVSILANVRVEADVSPWWVVVNKPDPVLAPIAHRHEADMATTYDVMSDPLDAQGNGQHFTQYPFSKLMGADACAYVRPYADGTYSPKGATVHPVEDAGKVLIVITDGVPNQRVRLLITVAD